jgi:hypothetical protein
MFPTETDTIMLQMGVFSLVCWSIAFPIIGVWVKRKVNGEFRPRVVRHPNGRVIRNAHG